MAEDTQDADSGLSPSAQQQRELLGNRYEEITGSRRPRCHGCRLFQAIEDPTIPTIGLAPEFNWGLCFAQPPARRTGYAFVKDFEFCPQHQDFVKIKQKEIER